MKYDAFISYRHAGLDTEIAKKVHTALEAFHVPASVQKKTGKKKINRVFRDHDELPIGSDLNDNITDAIKNSEYLIVICSPRTPGSTWVCKEIATFISLHGMNHVLTVLIEGEPSDSFPLQLLTDESGRPVEPLAADVRGADAKERNAKFKTEFLRLAASVLGCSYDDLKQRHRERILKRNIAIASSIAGSIAIAGTAFGIYNASVAKKMSQLADEKSQLAEEKSQLADEILIEYQDKQTNQSRYLAAESLELYASGNVMDAVLVAQAALPSDTEDRPYVPEAEYALGKALHAYSIGDVAEYSASLEHNGNVRDMKANSGHTKLISYDASGAVYAWDTSSGKEITHIAPLLDSVGSARDIIQIAITDDRILVCYEDAFTEYDLDGNLTAELENDSYIFACEIYPEAGIAIEVSSDELTIVSLDTCTKKEVITNSCELSYSHDLGYASDPGIIAVSHYSSGDENTYVELIDTSTLESTLIELSRNNIADLYMSSEGGLAILTNNKDDIFSFETSMDFTLDYIDAASSELLWSQELSPVISNALSYENFAIIHTYGQEGERRAEIAAVIDNTVFSFDLNGEPVSQISVSESIQSITFGSETDIGLVAEMDGNIDFVNFGTGSVTYSGYISTNKTIMDMITGGGTIAIRSQYDNNITLLRYEEASDLELLATTDYSLSELEVSPDGKYMIAVGESTPYAVYDENGSIIGEFDPGDDSYCVYSAFTKDDMYVWVTAEKAYVYNPKDGSMNAYNIPTADIDSSIIKWAGLCEDGIHLLARSDFSWILIDLESGHSTAHDYSDSMITGLAASDDAGTVYIMTADKALYAYDTETGKAQDPVNDELTNYSVWNQISSSLDISSDGNYASYLGADGFLKIVDLKSWAIINEIEISSSSSYFAEFTPDSKTLIYMSGDKVLHFLNVADNSSVAALELGGLVKDIDFDTNKDIISIKLSDELLLVSASSFSKLAEISCGEKYIAGSGRIITYSSREIHSLYYKDYKALLAEAAQKYGDCSLTEEDKVKYFLD